MEIQLGMGVERWDELVIPFKDIQLTNAPYPEKGYYYTTVDTLDKILTSGAIYSTNYRYLNDPGEWEFGYQELVNACQEILEECDRKSETEFVKNLKKTLVEEKNYLNDYTYPACNFLQGNYSEVFTISFTQEEDLISQWDRYAKESGVVIELDFSRLNQECFFYQETVNNRKIEINLRPQNVAYNKNEIMQISRNVFNILEEGFNSKNVHPLRLQTFVYMYMRYFASYIKNTAYEQEKEIRVSFYPLVFERDSKENIDKCDIKYTIQDGVFVPHIPIYCGRKKGEEIEKCGFPIRSIRVGPGYNQESVYKGLIHRMEYGSDYVEHLSESEQKERRLRFVVETMASYMGIDIHDAYSNRQILKKLSESQKSPKEFTAAEWKEIMKSIKSIYRTSSRDKTLVHKYPQIIELKQGCYNKIFRKAEENSYCTKDGIMIKRSEIPYIFSRK